ncbi:MAG TPA: hypothetical protein VGG23_05335 [Acidimicrobiales bacterium]
MTVPDELRGAWRRVGLEIDGEAVGTDGWTVLWLQAEECFADIRIRDRRPGPGASVPPLSGPGAFAGRAHWHEPWLTWDHELDMRAGAGRAVDRGRIERRGPRLAEHGELQRSGRRVPYVELWEPEPRQPELPPSEPPQPEPPQSGSGPAATSTERDEHRIRVEVGTLAIEVVDRRPAGAFRAALLRKSDDEATWSELAGLHEPGPG